MAGTSGILSSSEQIQANYEKYKSKFKDATEKMVNSPFSVCWLPK